MAQTLIPEGTTIQVRYDGSEFELDEKGFGFMCSDLEDEELATVRVLVNGNWEALTDRGGIRWLR